jgi:hypothetical protein
MASTDSTNAPEPIANDLSLLNYSYREDPTTPPPTLLSGDQLTLINSFSENGVEIPGIVNISLLQDNSTGALYVVTRGSANLQNAQSDLRLANDPVTRTAINYVEGVLQRPLYKGATVEFVGHSLGGNLNLRLADDWINWEQNINGLTTTEIADTVSVHNYNPIGVPDMSPAIEQVLAPVTTNFRLVIPDTQGALPNGMSVGDIVSAMVTLPGQTFEVAATPGTYQTFLDLHNLGPLMAADWENLTAMPINAPGLESRRDHARLRYRYAFLSCKHDAWRGKTKSPLSPGSSALRCRR